MPWRRKRSISIDRHDLLVSVRPSFAAPAQTICRAGDGTVALRPQLRRIAIEFRRDILAGHCGGGMRVTVVEGLCRDKSQD
jgi:hypothetical protein